MAPYPYMVDSRAEGTTKLQLSSTKKTRWDILLSFTLRILGGLIMQSQWSGSIRQCCTFTRHNTLRLPRPPLSPCPVSTIKLHLEPESRKLTNTNTNTNTNNNNNTNININTRSCLNNQTTSRGRIKKANQY